MPDDEQPPSDDDKFRPEAIAARIDRLGEETEADRIAREEEQKLLARKRDRKKTALETAASKRLAKIGEGKVKRPSVAVDAIPEADPLFYRLAQARQWIRGHQSIFGGVLAAAIAVAGGVIGYASWQDRRDAQASVLLAQGLADEHGRIAAKTDDTDDDSTAKQLYPTFTSLAEQRDAALAKYRAVQSKYAGTGAATLARLSEASLLLDGGDARAAASAYTDVKNSLLAKADDEVRGRSLEGLGFADELLARTDAAAQGKHLGDAMTEFKALEAVDVDGFKELGMYHEARVLLAQGDKAKAIELLKDLVKRVEEPGEGHSFAYLQFVVEDRLRELDPTALPPKPSKMGGLESLGAGGAGGGRGGIDPNDPKFREILRQLQQQQRQKQGDAPLPPLPGPTP